LIAKDIVAKYREWIAGIWEMGRDNNFLKNLKLNLNNLSRNQKKMRAQSIKHNNTEIRELQ